ncbi:MAG: hypothetical protein COC06_00270 [Bacteroidales bacterium]|nr:MAG: hypothetical protein COC06_00270 [Bacteroidales bacterium]
MKSEILQTDGYTTCPYIKNNHPISFMVNMAHAHRYFYQALDSVSEREECALSKYKTIAIVREKNLP